MKFQKRYTPIPKPLDRESRASTCPLLNIPRIDEHGMVLESQCGFDVGSTIALGFHLQCAPAASAKAGQCHVEAQHSTFISVEAIVVESKIGSSSAGQPVHLVTVLFSLISRKGREQLLRYSASRCSRPQPKPSLPTHSSPTPGDFNEQVCREVTRRIHLN